MNFCSRKRKLSSSPEPETRETQQKIQKIDAKPTQETAQEKFNTGFITPKEEVQVRSNSQQQQHLHHAYSGLLFTSDNAAPIVGRARRLAISIPNNQSPQYQNGEGTFVNGGGQGASGGGSIDGKTSTGLGPHGQPPVPSGFGPLRQPRISPGFGRPIPGRPRTPFRFGLPMTKRQHVSPIPGLPPWNRLPLLPPSSQQFEPPTRPFVERTFDYHQYTPPFLGTATEVMVHNANRGLRSSNKRSLNVESPAFTPATLPVPSRASTISSQAANAAPFTPRAMTSGSVTPNTQPDLEPTTFNPATIREFTPQNPLTTQNYDTTHTLASNGPTSENSTYDPFSMSTLNQAITFTQHNPYLEETASLASNPSAYYQTRTNFGAPQQPLQYHLYAPIGPHKEDLLPYQRGPHDFFISNDFREELQKKSEATQQVMQNSQLPVIDQYHTLVPLDMNHNKSATVFGFPSWVYKATSSKNGQTYVLRRLEGFRLSNERAIRCVKDWKRVDNASVVSVVDAFTTQAFRDSSLIFVYNYHPMSKTLFEHHFTSTNRYGNRSANVAVPESVLWGYIVQISSAIKSVHSVSLAVRCMDPSKILLTEKGRIRLNACSILDVVQFDANRPIAELQQEDFISFGKLILAIATNNHNVMSSTAPQLKGPVEHLARTYGPVFRDTITWLLSTTPMVPSAPKNIEDFLHGISTYVISAFDSSLHANDAITSTLSGELENGRLVRLLSKLGSINERPDYDTDPRWTEVGERYILKLFRDYVFHQVDAEGKPVVDLGHILMNLNKLDAGSNQMIKLISRDEQSTFIVTYKELKKQVEGAWGELVKGGASGKRF